MLDNGQKLIDKNKRHSFKINGMTNADLGSGYNVPIYRVNETWLTEKEIRQLFYIDGEVITMPDPLQGF